MRIRELNMNAKKAVALGHLLITVPVFVIILGSFMLGSITGLVPVLLLLLVLVSAGLAWLWWSLAIPRWRDWAHGRGADPDALQALGTKTCLVWPKGSIFEKTELPRRS